MNMLLLLHSLLASLPGQNGTDWPSEYRQVQADIEALSIDVTWSLVPWKTCLIEAYAQARKERKPLLIWALGGDPEGRC